VHFQRLDPIACGTDDLDLRDFIGALEAPANHVGVVDHEQTMLRDKRIHGLRRR
jgi:hypothetical protein